MREVNISGNLCVLTVNEYGNDRLAIQAMDKEEGDCYGTLTVNIPEADLADNEIFVKDWSENEPWVSQVLEQCPDIFEDTGRRQRTGFTSAAVWRIKDIKQL